MTLSVMNPTPTWDADAHEDTVAAFEALAADEDASIVLWCRDNCPDCRRELPDFAAALEAAEFPDDRVRQIPVDDDNDGELTGEYGVERIPTVVIERDSAEGTSAGSRTRSGNGAELARFVEEETLPAPQYLAAELRESGAV